VIALNGQQNHGNMTAKIMEDKGLNLKFEITTPSGHTFEQTLLPSEIISFEDSCKMKPTEAMFAVIDMQVKLSRMQLPAVIDDLGDIRSISTNAISSSALSAYDMLTDIRHNGNDIELCYLTNEQDALLSVANFDIENEQFIRSVTLEMAKDDDFREFLSSLAISHSNLILNYEGRISKQQFSIKIPYAVIREYCDVPKELLTIN
jgi:hypothetical protein